MDGSKVKSQMLPYFGPARTRYDNITLDEHTHENLSKHVDDFEMEWLCEWAKFRAKDDNSSNETEAMI